MKHRYLLCLYTHIYPALYSLSLWESANHLLIRGTKQPLKANMERNERRYIPLNYAQSHLNAMSGSENRRASAVPPSSAIRPSQNKENPYYNRRRTADNFPGPGLVHNGPAVVRSTLTASATMNELGKSIVINFQFCHAIANNDPFSQSV
jgi:hypothetical protein